MTRMDRLARALGDVDELLEQADAQTIDESLARSEAPDHRDVDGCPWCHHEFHGLGCYPAIEYLWRSSLWLAEVAEHEAIPLMAPGGWGWPCRCDSALVRPDDTWRPPVDQWDVTWLMHVTGLDGYTARALRERALAQIVAPIMAAVEKIVSDAPRWTAGESLGFAVLTPSSFVVTAVVP